MNHEKKPMYGRATRRSARDRAWEVEVRVRFTPGGVLKVPLPDGQQAFAIMLKESPQMAFYGPDEGLASLRPPRGQPLFIVSVYRNAYSVGNWGPIQFRLPADILPPIPSFFRQDILNPKHCEIDDPSGESRVVDPAECQGLEPNAVWDRDHIEGRIEDHLAQRANVWVEAMRLKL